MYEKYSKIPNKVKVSKEISSNAKLLYGEIKLLSNSRGYCYASNKYLADIFGLSTRTITRLIRELENCSLIKIEYLKNSRIIYVL